MMNDMFAYLKMSLHRLEKTLPSGAEEMLRHYRFHPEDWKQETWQGYIFCLFSWKEQEAERIVLLVYDGDSIAADLAALHCSQDTLMNSTAFYDAVSEESDWMYLEHYVLSQCLYPDLAYPHCMQKDMAGFGGEALLYTNAYVSRGWRRKGIFRHMEEMVRAFSLRKCSGLVRLGAVFAMDPDIACYGPDTPEQPYVYSFEKDEPDRLRNAEIARKLGYVPMRLEETEPETDTDGTKLWFCVRIENSMML